MLTGLGILFALGSATVGFAAGAGWGLASGSRRARRNSHRETLQRNSDYTEIIDEDEAGYGIAIGEEEVGVRIIRYNDEDEIYNQASIHEDQLEAVANHLSERACEKERVEA